MIFGTDDRTPIYNTAIDPWRVVVQITADFPNGLNYTATGVMVGPNDVVTSAHNIFAPELGGYASNIRITPARSGPDSPFGSSGILTAQVDPGWVSNAKVGNYEAAFDHDMALLTLSNPLGYQTGFAGLDVLATPLGRLVTSAGYPTQFSGTFLYRTGGTVDTVTAKSLRFTDDLDMSPGHSGAPVFGSDGSVMGLISFEISQGSPQVNGVFRFDAADVEQLNFWAATNDQTGASDYIVGSDYSEFWDGFEGDDTIAGMDGDDTIFGSSGDDDLNGNKGNDGVIGEGGNDFVRGGQGDDFVFGEDGDDWHVNGNIGNDYVSGGNGNDNVYGGPGADTLFGGAGDDILSGDLGDDTMTGGSGRDVFSHSPGTNVVADFVKGTDIIRIPSSSSVFHPVVGGGSTRIEYDGGEMVILGAPFGSLQLPDLWLV